METYLFVDQPHQADLCILPMSWQYFLLSQRKDTALKFIARCKEAGKRTAVWNLGDFGHRLPLSLDIIDVRPSGYRSRRQPFHLTTPVFIPDPLPALSRQEIVTLPHEPTPRIAFCGQGQDALWQRLGKRLRLFLHNASFYSGFSSLEPQPMLPPTQMRENLCRGLTRDHTLDCNFILRQKYQAGARSEEAKQLARNEFLNNLDGSPYALCIRGSGNFSARFYEAMAMGRIPVLVDTDGNLPCESRIDWQREIVIVPWRERHRLSAAIHSYHNRFDRKSFPKQQVRMRDLWVEHLSYGGFWGSFPHTFHQVQGPLP
jgi:hypothetical protein